MYGLAALLAEKDFVDVGFQDALLVVARLDQQRQQRFVQLAREGLAAIEKQVLDQLLGQRRTALHDVARDQVDPCRAQDRDDIDAVVALEVAILDRLQAAEQQRRDLAELDHAAVFLLRPVQRRDPRRLQPYAGHGGSGVGIGKLRHAAVAKRDGDALVAFASVQVDESAPRIVKRAPSRWNVPGVFASASST